MNGLPVVRLRQLIRALERAGFLCTTCGAETTTFGIRKNPGVLVTIPYHNRDLKRGTLRSILRQAGIASANQAG